MKRVYLKGQFTPEFEDLFHRLVAEGWTVMVSYVTADEDRELHKIEVE